MRRLASCIVKCGVVAMCAGLAGGDVVAGQPKRVEATSGWVKAPAAGETTATAFVDVDNPTMYDVYLMSAVTDLAGTVEFRDKSQKGDPQGQVRKTVTVPAYGSIAMDPNGVYLLLTDLKRPLKGGDTVSLTLRTDGGVELQVSAAVRKE
jgi:copper(I)-binding protein